MNNADTTALMRIAMDDNLARDQWKTEEVAKCLPVLLKFDGRGDTVHCDDLDAVEGEQITKLWRFQYVKPIGKRFTMTDKGRRFWIQVYNAYNEGYI